MRDHYFDQAAFYRVPTNSKYECNCFVAQVRASVCVVEGVMCMCVG